MGWKKKYRNYRNDSNNYWRINSIFINNFAIIVASRLLVGAGIGLFTSLAVSLIGDCFSGEEQKTLIGIQGAMGTLGNSSMTFVAGLYWASNGRQHSCIS